MQCHYFADIDKFDNIDHYRIIENILCYRSSRKLKHDLVETFSSGTIKVQIQSVIELKVDLVQNMREFDSRTCKKYCTENFIWAVILPSAENL